MNIKGSISIYYIVNRARYLSKRIASIPLAEQLLVALFDVYTFRTYLIRYCFIDLNSDLPITTQEETATQDVRHHLPIQSVRYPCPF